MSKTVISAFLSLIILPLTSTNVSFGRLLIRLISISFPLYSRLNSKLLFPSLNISENKVLLPCCIIICGSCCALNSIFNLNVLYSDRINVLINLSISLNVWHSGKNSPVYGIFFWNSFTSL